MARVSRAAFGGRRPLTASRLRKKEASAKSTALPAKLAPPMAGRAFAPQSPRAAVGARDWRSSARATAQVSPPIALKDSSPAGGGGRTAVTDRVAMRIEMNGAGGRLGSGRRPVDVADDLQAAAERRRERGQRDDAARESSDPRRARRRRRLAPQTNKDHARPRRRRLPRHSPNTRLVRPMIAVAGGVCKSQAPRRRRGARMPTAQFRDRRSAPDVRVQKRSAPRRRSATSPARRSRRTAVRTRAPAHWRRATLRSRGGSRRNGWRCRPSRI